MAGRTGSWHDWFVCIGGSSVASVIQYDLGSAWKEAQSWLWKIPMPWGRKIFCCLFSIILLYILSAQPGIQWHGHGLAGIIEESYLEEASACRGALWCGILAERKEKENSLAIMTCWRRVQTSDWLNFINIYVKRKAWDFIVKILYKTTINGSLQSVPNLFCPCNVCAYALIQPCVYVKTMYYSCV